MCEDLRALNILKNMAISYEGYREKRDTQWISRNYERRPEQDWKKRFVKDKNWLKLEIRYKLFRHHGKSLFSDMIYFIMDFFLT